MQVEPKRVVIVGAGFGGLRAARALARDPVRVTLVSQRNYHLFQPLLYQIATAGLSPDQIAHPVRSILKGQRNFEFVLAEVLGVDFDARTLRTQGGLIPYDFLVLAMGGQTNTFGLPGVERFGFGLKDIDDATAIRNHILTQFELATRTADPVERRARLTFAVVGGGPTGVECSGAISELVRLVLRRDYPALRIEDVCVILYEAGDRLLPGMPDRLSDFTVRTLARKHVEVRLNTQVEGFDGAELRLKGEPPLPARTLIWAAGVRVADLGDAIDTPQGRLGRLVVEPTLQLPTHPEVYAIGDAAYLTDAQGQPLPMVAPVAMQQADIAAGNIRRQLNGQPLLPFNYRDPGSLATIGRSSAVARLGRWQFTGLGAWMVWLVVHILQLIGFRNRIIVLVNWVWDYLFYDRPIRIIEPAIAEPHGVDRLTIDKGEGK